MLRRRSVAQRDATPTTGPQAELLLAVPPPPRRCYARPTDGGSNALCNTKRRTRELDHGSTSLSERICPKEIKDVNRSSVCWVGNSTGGGPRRSVGCYR